MWAKHKQYAGFTIVELLIVIVVISILAAITVVAYNGIQARAKAASRDSDIALINRAILAARINTGKTTVATTVTGMTSYNCQRVAGNPGLVEPKLLNNTSHQCWIDWRSSLDKLAVASGMNLTSLYKGDPDGNPYYLNENEGENNGGNSCTPDDLGYFNGGGVNFVIAKTIPAAAGSTC